VIRSGSLEEGAEDAEQLGAWSRAERIEPLTWLALELVGSQGRRLRRCVSANESERPRCFGPTSSRRW